MIGYNNEAIFRVKYFLHVVFDIRILFSNLLYRYYGNETQDTSTSMYDERKVAADGGDDGFLRHDERKTHRRLI